MYRLKNSGYKGLLVGGGVRDLLLGREPKDFDVATDATPEQVNELFRNCRLIGRRFRLAHVRFGREIIETATFRGTGDGSESDDHSLNDEGRVLRDNVYGSLEEDAWRRDFTINALYYNIEDFSVIDYTNGMEDLRNGVIRLIGEPEKRYREDPVRMIRAVRFAAKLGFRIHEQAEQALFEMGHLLQEVAPARLFDEVLKLLMSGVGVQTFELLRHYDLFRYLFPMTDEALAQEENAFPHILIARALSNTDARIAEGKPVTPAFLFAALLWDTARQRAEQIRQTEDLPVSLALQRAAATVVSDQAGSTAVPKRFSLPMREIWSLQDRFNHRRGRRAKSLLAHKRFRAAYDFLLLRVEAGEAEQELADWWTRIQEVDETEQEKMFASGPPGSGGRRKRRRRPAQKRETNQ